MATGAALYPPLNQRPMKNTLVLFDVDNTLTIPRQVYRPRLSQFSISALRRESGLASSEN